jgi:hypothetical protein
MSLGAFRYGLKIWKMRGKAGFIGCCVLMRVTRTIMSRAV